MAVFTQVTTTEAGNLLTKLGLGTLTDLRGISGGIENTNYFVTSELDGVVHEHVLTLFELSLIHIFHPIVSVKRG